MSATFRVQLAGQTVPLRFQTVSFGGIRALVEADVITDINARVPKNTDGSDFTQPAAVRAAIGAVGTDIVGVDVGAGLTPNDPAIDATAAFNAAIATGGARPHFPLGDWYGNFQTSETNVVIVGQGGDSEASGGGGEVLRPYDDTLPTVQFGGDGVLTFGNGVRDLAISGLNADTGVQAPAALLLAGGVANSFSSHFTLTDGVHSLSLQPGDEQPVTCAFFDNFHIRNGTHTAGSRAIYLQRNADADEYLTSISFTNGHINGPTDGYAVEINGEDNGIAVSFVNTYIDFAPGHHVLIKGSSLLMGFNLQIDPDQLDTVVIETDGTSLDPTTVLAGMVRVEGNKMRNSLGVEHTFASDWFLRNPYISDALFYGQLNFTTLANRARTTHYLAMVTDDGPLGVYGMDLSVRNTTESTDLDTASLQTEGGASITKALRVGGNIEIYGGNATSGGFISSNSASGGLFIGSNQSGEDIQIAAGGGGYIRIRGGDGIRPHLDNTDANGIVGAAWEFSTSYEYRDGAGLKLLGARKTGWAVATGTATRTTFDTATVTLPQLAERLKALIDDLHATAGHGLIGT